jgi:hypothetical protein
VPCLARFTLRLDEEHRLHGLDIGPYQLGEDRDEARQREQLERERGQLVREVDAEHPPQSLIVRGARPRGLQAGDGATLPTAQQDALTAERPQLSWLEQVVQDHEPVAPVNLDIYGHRVTPGPVNLAGFAIIS